MRRSDRLFDVIQRLRTASKPVTAAMLAAELEVTPRTVYRDIATLQARRVLSRLRDRHFATWRVDDTAADLREMDELALARFARRGEDDTTGGTDA